MKQQHLERTTNFLTEELKCVSKREATDRVFFVSALEVSFFDSLAVQRAYAVVWDKCVPTQLKVESKQAPFKDF